MLCNFVLDAFGGPCSTAFHMSQREKLTETMRFRASSSFASTVADLSIRSGWDVSDILRTGLEMHWPDIEASVLHRSGNVSAVSAEEREALTTARRAGVDPVAALLSAAEIALSQPNGLAAAEEKLKQPPAAPASGRAGKSSAMSR